MGYQQENIPKSFFFFYTIIIMIRKIAPTGQHLVLWYPQEVVYKALVITMENNTKQTYFDTPKKNTFISKKFPCGCLLVCLDQQPSDFNLLLSLVSHDEGFLNKQISLVSYHGQTSDLNQTFHCRSSNCLPKLVHKPTLLYTPGIREMGVFGCKSKMKRGRVKWILYQ